MSVPSIDSGRARETKELSQELITKENIQTSYYSSCHVPRQIKSSNLKSLRRARGFTLEELSERTGISPSYLSRLEAGARRLNSDLLETLAMVLGCQPGDLLPGITAQQSTTRSLSTREGHLNHCGVIRVHSRYSGDSQDSDASMHKDLPVYLISPEAGIFPGEGGDAPYIDLTNPCDWTFRPPQLMGVRTAFALYVRDEESLPRYHFPWDILFVHTSRPLSLRCPIVAITKDDRAIVRQFLGWGEEDILLSPFTIHPESEARSIPRDMLRAVYKIIGSMEATTDESLINRTRCNPTSS